MENVTIQVREGYPPGSQIFTFNQILTLTQKVTLFWPHENVTIMTHNL